MKKKCACIFLKILLVAIILLLCSFSLYSKENKKPIRLQNEIIENSVTIALKQFIAEKKWKYNKAGQGPLLDEPVNIIIKEEYQFSIIGRTYFNYNGSVNSFLIKADFPCSSEKDEVIAAGSCNIIALQNHANKTWKSYIDYDTCVCAYYYNYENEESE
ncbi:MAG: hypothetical protein ABIA04_08060 [Pseudomonadota bacterium]